MRYLLLLKDWIWFVFYLKCNEFSHRLDLNLNCADKYKSREKKEKAMHKESLRIVKLRNKAHEMDHQWSDFKKKYNFN